MKLLPRWLRDNFRIKSGLFLLATLLWLLVVTQRSYEHLIRIPIVVVGLKPGKVIVNEIPALAEVKFHAQGRELFRMQFFNHPYLRLDISTISYFYTFRPRLDMIVVTGGLNAQPIDVVTPDSIQVVLGDRFELKLPVSPRIKALPAAGYTFVGEVEVNPPEVKLIGPREKIVRLTSIKTTAVELEDVKRNTELQLDLELPDIYGLKVIPPQVKALIRVERLGEHEIKRVPLKVINIPRGKEIIVDPLTVDVKISGGISLISKLEADSIKAWVDFREYDMVRRGSAPVHVELRKNAEVLQIKPADVRLIVRRK